MVAFRMCPTGDLAHNPGVCPDWESNMRPFSSQASTQSTEPHQAGQDLFWSLQETIYVKYLEQYPEEIMYLGK